MRRYAGIHANSKNKGRDKTRTITARKYNDESTTELYKFVFFCERCEKVVSIYQSKSANCYTPKFFEAPSKRRAQELLWLTDHKTAFENASREALRKLNRCEGCGALVCNACSIIDDESGGNVYCTDCIHKKHGNK